MTVSIREAEKGGPPMKEFMFRSPENFGRVALIFVIILIVSVLFTFIKALAFCKRTASAPPALVGVNYGDGGSDSGDEVSQAIRITQVVAVFIVILEACFFGLLLLS